jgi:hypothetical protein
VDIANGAPASSVVRPGITPVDVPDSDLIQAGAVADAQSRPAAVGSRQTLQPNPLRIFGVDPERVVRRILRVEKMAPRDPSSVHRAFNVSVVLSGLRCLLSYVVAPFVVPALGVFSVPSVGIGLSCLAVVFDVRALRRFWLVNYRHRWGMTLLYTMLIGLVLGLLVIDVHHLMH